MLGSGGFGPYDTRVILSRHFEVDRVQIAHAAIAAVVMSGSGDAARAALDVAS